MTDEERAAEREERDRKYHASIHAEYTAAGFECRKVQNFVIGLRRLKEPGQLQLILTDYHDDGTSSAYLTAEDLAWIAETGARLLAG